MTYQELVSGPQALQRYWARAHVGWTRMREAEPNAGHAALARLQRQGRVELLVTQNVDGLHERAASAEGLDPDDVVALHGRISDVVCLDCRTVFPRTRVQARMAELNPGYAERHAEALANPDGDVALEVTSDFVVAGCEVCGGRLKPDVVFFGENVPKPRVQRVYDALDRADALLVVGSSLTVMSGFRFVRHAAKRGQPVVIVNRGATRGDDLADVRLEEGTTEFLETLAGPIAAYG
ncbi:hypothetical protein LUZ63_020201 [Rhynchospora breviuscula]|uniref:Deacetylase sirtuin-type domain-containing protein n=1 Tax=Rhynchospora breviuscula TaxID=2022672 RepID=A0A9P9Z9P8_9POAL|nr:hypothetical protein LUZ63_020201 [Rhynchospora breviuscula]